MSLTEKPIAAPDIKKFLDPHCSKNNNEAMS